jgi:hypothetical protein
VKFHHDCVAKADPSLKAFPIDGRLVALPPDTDDSTRNGK